MQEWLSKIEKVQWINKNKHFSSRPYETIVNNIPLCNNIQLLFIIKTIVYQPVF